MIEANKATALLSITIGMEPLLYYCRNDKYNEHLVTKEDSGMKMQGVREIAKAKGVKAGKMDKTELIRAIQRAEGNTDCFAGNNVSGCDRLNCLWREDCGAVIAA